MSQPRYPSPVAPARAIARLAAAAANPHHTILDAPVSLLDGGTVDPTQILSSRQVTDVYLLAIAARHKVRLVTFDQAIPLGAVRGASAANVLVLRA